MATIKGNFTKDNIMTSSLRNKSNSVKNEFYLNLGKTIVKDDGSEVFYKFGGITISIDNITEIKNTSGNEEIDFANTFVEYLKDQMDSLNQGNSTLIPEMLFNCIEIQLFRASNDEPVAVEPSSKKLEFLNQLKALSSK
jgi:hypothetical protein